MLKLGLVGAIFADLYAAEGEGLRNETCLHYWIFNHQPFADLADSDPRLDISIVWRPGVEKAEWLVKLSKIIGESYFDTFVAANDAFVYEGIQNALSYSSEDGMREGIGKISKIRGRMGVERVKRTVEDLRRAQG